MRWNRARMPERASSASHSPSRGVRGCGRVEADHRRSRSSETHAVASPDTSGRAWNSGSTWRSRNGSAAWSSSNGTRDATGRPRSVMTMSSPCAARRTHSPVFLCRSRIVIRMMCPNVSPRFRAVDRHRPEETALGYCLIGLSKENLTCMYIRRRIVCYPPAVLLATVVPQTPTGWYAPHGTVNSRSTGAGTARPARRRLR